jgi:hypothetical protein
MWATCLGWPHLSGTTVGQHRSHCTYFIRMPQSHIFAYTVYRESEVSVHTRFTFRSYWQCTPISIPLLNNDLKKYGEGVCTKFAYLRIGFGVGSCERGNAPSDSIKCGEFLDWLADGLLASQGLCSNADISYNNGETSAWSIHSFQMRSLQFYIPC